MKRRRVLRWLMIIFIIYVAGGVAIYFFQDAILFHPVQLKKDHRYNFPQKHEDFDVPLENGSNLNIVRFLTVDSIKKGLVLYFHGNKKNISWYAKYPPYFTKHGYETWMIDYPGYGKSTGKFDEQTVYDRARRMYELASTNYHDDSILIYGKSMGTGIAAQLASVKHCKRLILETPYYDFPSVVKRYLPFYPVDKMIHFKIPTWQYLLQVKAPVTIFHGTDDGVISYRNAERLKPFLKRGDEFVTIKDGSHNDLYDYRQMTGKLDSLLSR